MEAFKGEVAVVTGGGSGIGRALVVRLAQAGRHVAACDIREAALAETRGLALETAAQGAQVSTFMADVSNVEQVAAFREHVAAQHGKAVHLVFNNAGVAGGGSFVLDPPEVWERTFDVCWGGVYNVTRAFLPMLMKAQAGRLVNVSSVNGFWASLGPGTAHTAYSAAKFAVKGFTEALIGDLRMNAPTVSVSLVMPGHVGTSIAHNTIAEFGPGMDEAARRELIDKADTFRAGGLTPDQAAEIILDGVREGRWRILVGPDAQALDQVVRASPETAYDPEFYTLLAAFAGQGG